MSLDALIAELTRAAEQEADLIRSEAALRVRDIDQAAEAHARSKRESAIARLDEAQRQGVASQTAAAARANRQALLEARARLLDQVFTRAATLLAITDGARYREGLPALVDSTLRYLEGTPAELRCRPDISAGVRELCDGMADVRVAAADDADAGLLGESLDCRLLVDNSLPALLERRRAELGVVVALRLEEA